MPRRAIVDDHGDSRESLSMVLAHAGFVVRTAAMMATVQCYASGSA